MRIKKGFLLRKAAQENIVIYVGDDENGFNGMIQLNNAGVILWNMMTEGKTRQEIVTAMLGIYVGLNEETAKRDLDGFIKTIEFALEDVEVD